ncbi:M48 family metalloprotease [Zophobihabitans entericus]|uniref:M48 family metalloprotease n=1 Tax=Zophobihabitans entericus TaxID=1635327 RepID=A0A6G9I7R6_9GAMM|nr:M48 family metalloprotease [Zophobihabitans entericus]QIQ20246.1 M48 family metalloprotease [Zophobihabitans entericus]
MLIKFSQRVLLLIVILLTGCQNQPTVSSYPPENFASLTEQDIIEISRQFCADQDSTAFLLAKDSNYQKRLNHLADTLGYQLHGQTLNYRVYLDSNINAWSTASGCIRVTTGMLKAFTDSEIQAVIAHEFGHIELQHKLRSFQHAQRVEMGKDINSIAIYVEEEFAHKLEIEADNYALAYLQKHNLDASGMLTMFDKMPQDNNQVLSTHPTSAERLNNIKNKLKLNQ